MTKRKKLAKRFERLTLLLMSSGVHTASGKEESVKPIWDENDPDIFSQASDKQLTGLAPTIGAPGNGFDVNIAGVRMITAKRHIREHTHAEFIISTKRAGKVDVYVARRYGAFGRLYSNVIIRFFKPTTNLSCVPSSPVKISLGFLRRTGPRQQHPEFAMQFPLYGTVASQMIQLAEVPPNQQGPPL